jgi:DNA-binding GntR family transcriptional regulator
MIINLKPLGEQVYEFLRGELYKGNLVPGSSINLNEISRKLGTSKTPLRDALIQLAAEGFVTISPRRGIFVNVLTLDDIRHCYEIAGGLEVSVILTNFERIDAERISRMKRINNKLRGAIARLDYDSYYQLNLDFHNVFIELSDNTMLRRMVDTIKQRLYDFPRRGYITQWELNNCDEHQLLIEAWEKGDRNGAARVWLEVHWSFQVQERFIRQFYFPDGECSEDSAACVGK